LKTSSITVEMMLPSKKSGLIYFPNRKVNYAYEPKGGKEVHNGRPTHFGVLKIVSLMMHFSKKVHHKVYNLKRS
jgi:hypothetical protein